MVQVNKTGLSIARRSPAGLASIIMDSFQFACNPAGELYYYENGVYKVRAELYIDMLYRTMLIEEYGDIEKWKSLHRDEIIKCIRGGVPQLWDRPPEDTINLKNGIWNIETRTLVEHTPKYLSTIQVGINYDPDATCHNWDKFCSELIEVNGGRELIYDIIGLCMTSVTSLQTAIVIIGGGSNGKSTLLYAIREAIGRENVSCIKMKTLTDPKERFALPGLANKLCNFDDDVFQGKVEDTSVFKSLVSGEPVRMEPKGKMAYTATPFCKYVFATNHAIRSDDKSVGFKRRIIHIPFLKEFRVDPGYEQDLKEQLTDPKEQSGMLNRALERLPQVVRGEFTNTVELVSIIESYVNVPLKVRLWIDEHVVEHADGFLPVMSFYDMCMQNCYNPDPWERAKVAMYLKSMYPKMSGPFRGRTADGKRIQVYKGIKMREQCEQDYLMNTSGEDRDSSSNVVQ